MNCECTLALVIKGCETHDPMPAKDGRYTTLINKDENGQIVGHTTIVHDVIKGEVVEE